jgi:ribonucleoside-diphosphate reductase alpha chain
MTVYRDGSRTGVLVSGETKKEADFIETEAPRRPHKLEAEVIRFQNDYEKWISFVGLYNGRPYEIFTGKADDFWVPAWVEKGWIFKNKLDKGQSRYDFQYEDKEGYKVTMEGLSRSFNKEYWNYAKLISGILRHGMPLQFVVHVVNTLDLRSESINTWKNGVERALKKYIPDGTKAARKTCPNPDCGDPRTWFTRKVAYLYELWIHGLLTRAEPSWFPQHESITTIHVRSECCAHAFGGNP